MPFVMQAYPAPAPEAEARPSSETPDQQLGLAPQESPSESEACLAPSTCSTPPSATRWRGSYRASDQCDQPDGEPLDRSRDRRHESDKSLALDRQPTEEDGECDHQRPVAANATAPDRCLGTHPPSPRDSAPGAVPANPPVHHPDPSPRVIQRK